MKIHTGVMVFAEQKAGVISPISYELLGKGREIADKLGAELSCVLLGNQIEDEAQELIYYGADKVFLYDCPAFKGFDLLNYKHNIVKLAKEVQPDVFLLGATHLGRSLAPRIAVALSAGLAADCIGLDVDRDGNLIYIRPAFSGDILAHMTINTSPQMSTIRYRVMTMRARDAGRSGEIIKKDAELVPSLITILGNEKADEVNIVEANVIVAGGRGLKKAEDLTMLAHLANLLGGAVGVSRPLVDDGWAEKERQVGFSGNMVKPKLYIACGISGSPQHLAGMRGSDIIVAINTDPSAPIFRVVDYGIVGDLYDIIPQLTNVIKGR
ncbi:MAG: electron transfer flavoprotein subunit alpha/FixB family protein [Dehalococcoidia bacterium]|nr:electron transfer flavoprotein subunit alpha/FixB family protein [Dehalococcoidia bacterium]